MKDCRPCRAMGLIQMRFIANWCISDKIYRLICNDDELLIQIADHWYNPCLMQGKVFALANIVVNDIGQNTTEIRLSSAQIILPLEFAKERVIMSHCPNLFHNRPYYI